jgi:hypothetical protein
MISVVISSQFGNSGHLLGYDGTPGSSGERDVQQTTTLVLARTWAIADGTNGLRNHDGLPVFR